MFVENEWSLLKDNLLMYDKQAYIVNVCAKSTVKKVYNHKICNRS